MRRFVTFLEMRCYLVDCTKSVAVKQKQLTFGGKLTTWSLLNSLNAKQCGDNIFFFNYMLHD